MKSNLQGRRWLVGILIVAVAIGAPIFIITKVNYDYSHKPARQIIVSRPDRNFGQKVTALAFSPNDMQLADYENQGTVQIRTVPDLIEQHTFSHAGGMAANFLQWNLAGTELTLGDSTKLKFLDILGKSNRPQLEDSELNLPNRSKNPFFFHDFMASPDGTLAAEGRAYGTVKVWEIKTQKLFFAITARPPVYDNNYDNTERNLCSLAFSKDAKVLAVVSIPNTVLTKYPEISLYDAHTGKVLRTWIWKTKATLFMADASGNLGYMALAFSPDDRTLASADGSNVDLWNIKTGYHIRTLHGDETSTYLMQKQVRFFPNGNWLAASGFGTQIFVWNTNSGRLAQVFYGPHITLSEAISPNGHWLAIGGQDKNGEGTLSLWDVSRFQ